MNTQPDLLTWINTRGPRDGESFRPDRDEARLDRQSDKVWSVVSDGQWRTPKDLEKSTGYDWASISARLRDYRKQKFGSHRVEKRYVQSGVWVYRVLVSQARAA